MQIAFIGLGNMGAPMARNLLKAGHAVAVCDLNTDAVAALVAEGAHPCATPAEATCEAHLVLTMLPAPAHVDKVLTGPDGVFGAILPGVPIVDCSTIDPASARRLAKMALAQGNELADAPVSGGTGGAAAGTLTFMVGASEALFARIQPVLQAMGKRIVHCGDVGNGQVAKVCNNLLLGISMIGVSEAMALGVSQGMDPKVLADIINASSGRCWSSDTYNPFPGVMGGRARLSRLPGRLWRGPDAQGPGPGGRSRAPEPPAPAHGRAGPAALPGLERTRPGPARFLFHPPDAEPGPCRLS
jgi:3-hydroxyisobutyrate dehydrogenase